MKKICSLLLVCVMLLGIFPVMSFATEGEKVVIEPYDPTNHSGWENISGATVAHTYLLINLNTKKYDCSQMDYDWEITFDDGKTAKTVTLKSVSKYVYQEESILYRFLPVDATGANQFIPEVGVNYSVSVRILKNGKCVLYSAPTPGFIVKPEHKPIVSNFTYHLDTNGTLTVSGKGFLGVDGDRAANDYPWVDRINDIKKVVVEDGITGIGTRAFYFEQKVTEVVIGKDCKSFGYESFSWDSAIQKMTIKGTIDRIHPNCFFLCSALNTIVLEQQSKEDFLKILPVSPENLRKAEIIEGAEEQDSTMIIEPLDTDNSISFENTVQEGDSKEETQFIIVAYDARYVGGGYQWKITFSDGTSSKTVTLEPTTIFNVTDQVPADQYPNGAALYRFQPCNGEGENQFIPKAGVNYNVTVQVMKDGEVVAESAETAGFGTPADFVPVVPATPEPPVTGDATAYIAVLAVVALFGTAFVVTKKILA